MIVKDYLVSNIAEKPPNIRKNKELQTAWYCGIVY